MVERHQLEVDALNERPYHPVRLQCRPVALIQFILRTRALHDSHTAEEDEQIGAGKDCLVACHPGDDLGILVLQHHFVLQEFEPGRGSGTEDSCATVLSAPAMVGEEPNNLPPPYNAIRPVLAKSCFSNPFFSTSCCAMVSPVANNTAVVTLCVRIGREASFIWYLQFQLVHVSLSLHLHKIEIKKKLKLLESNIPSEHLCGLMWLWYQMLLLMVWKFIGFREASKPQIPPKARRRQGLTSVGQLH